MLLLSSSCLQTVALVYFAHIQCISLYSQRNVKEGSFFLSWHREKLSFHFVLNHTYRASLSLWRKQSSSVMSCCEVTVGSRGLWAALAKVMFLVLSRCDAVWTRPASPLMCDYNPKERRWWGKKYRSSSERGWGKKLLAFWIIHRALLKQWNAFPGKSRAHLKPGIAHSVETLSMHVVPESTLSGVSAGGRKQGFTTPW